MVLFKYNQNYQRVNFVLRFHINRLVVVHREFAGLDKMTVVLRGATVASI